MKTKHLTPEERYDLVMECRRSGLTDRQWCINNGIHPTTFYRWISKFREKGFPNVPDSSHGSGLNPPEIQEVVRLSVLSENDESHACDVCGPALKQKISDFDPVTIQFIPVAEISSGDITLRISNEISPETADVLLRYVRGSL